MKGKKIDLKFLEKAEKFVSSNGSTLAIVGAMIGLVGTVYSAFKASESVSTINKDYVNNCAEIEKKAISVDEKAKEKKDVKNMRNVQYILAYKWVILCGGSTLALMLLSKYIDGLAISGLAALVAAKQDEIKSLTENAKKMLGEEKFQELEDKVLEEKVLRNFVTSDGEHKGFKLPLNYNQNELFVDTQEGIIIPMKREDMIASLDWAEQYNARNHELSKEKYYSHLGILYKQTTKYQYWGPNNLFKAHIGQRKFCGVMFPTIEYDTAPRFGGI